jgi:hypothetical protein
MTGAAIRSKIRRILPSGVVKWCISEAVFVVVLGVDRTDASLPQMLPTRYHAEDKQLHENRDSDGGAQAKSSWCQVTICEVCN